MPGVWMTTQQWRILRNQYSYWSISLISFIIEKPLLCFSSGLLIASFILQARSSPTSLCRSQYFEPRAPPPMLHFPKHVLFPGYSSQHSWHEGKPSQRCPMRVCVLPQDVCHTTKSGQTGYSQIIPSQTCHLYLCYEGSGFLFFWVTLFKLFKALYSKPLMLNHATWCEY